MRGLVLLALALPLAAQPTHPRHSVTLGAGAALPGGELSGAFSNSAGVSVSYGYRWRSWLQADAGLDAVFGAARVRDFIPSEYGYLRIRDLQYLIPAGARLVLPVSDGRWMLSAGGGGAYMRYSERLNQPSSYYRFACPACSSRSGWGTYALAAASRALDRYQMFRVGVTSRFYRGYTDGGSLGTVPAVKTRDRWVNLFVDFTVNF